jgi:hypothetical protein
MASKYNFSDIFISYSRKTSPFVRKIADDLTKRGYEIWVDWEDIPETADWWEEICAGIDAANTFIFVVSPASAESSVCYKEVDYAHQNHKRIVPLLAEPITDNALLEKLHPSIRSHNWLNFDSDTGSFEDKIENLLKILTIDLDNLRLHTRYLVRAREWKERGRDKSFLLRGMDAYEAKLWLDANREKTPATLPLQQNYVEASLQQKELDDSLQSQQETIRYIDLRVFPAFFLTLFTLAFYTWLCIPQEELQDGARLQLAFGVSVTSGFVIMGMVLYADELLRLRYPDNQLFRLVASCIYSFAFGCSISGFLQITFFQLRLDMPIIFLNGLAVAIGIIGSAAFKLRGWQAFLISCISIFIGIQLTYESPERPWEGIGTAIYYFNSDTQAQWLSIFLAIGLSFAMFADPIMRDILDLVKHFQKPAQ